MTEIKIGETVIKDAEAFLASHEQYKADIAALRTENTSLKTQAEAGSPEEVDKWRSRAIRSEAKARLDNDGIKDSERVLKRLNLEGVDFDDNNNLVGFDDAVSEFKNDFPELFDKKLRAAGKADIHDKANVEPAKSVSEMQAEALFNN